MIDAVPWLKKELAGLCDQLFSSENIGEITMDNNYELYRLQITKVAGKHNLFVHFVKTTTPNCIAFTLTSKPTIGETSDGDFLSNFRFIHINTINIDVHMKMLEREIEYEAKGLPIKKQLKIIGVLGVIRNLCRKCER